MLECFTDDLFLYLGTGTRDNAIYFRRVHCAHLYQHLNRTPGYSKLSKKLLSVIL